MLLFSAEKLASGKEVNVDFELIVVEVLKSVTVDPISETNGNVFELHKVDDGYIIL